MHVVDERDADLYLDGIPLRLDYALEWHLARHLADCGRQIEPSRLRTWDELANELDDRFPPHVWHPRHWDRYDQAHPPEPEAASPAQPPEQPTWRKKSGKTTPQMALLGEE